MSFLPGRAGTRLGSRAEKWAGAYCDRVIFVNQEERELAIERGWLPAEKCLTIYNGVDLEAFAPGLRRYARNHFQQQCGLENDEIAILMLGRLDRQKQPLILPRIAARLQSLLPAAKWRILVAGAGPLKPALARDVQRLGLESRVTLLDWQADPQQTIQAADIVLHPTLWEGLPLALIEAQAVAAKLRPSPAISKATARWSPTKRAFSARPVMPRLLLRHWLG